IRLTLITVGEEFPRENTDKKVEDEYKLLSTENKRRNTDEHIDGLLRLKKNVLCRIVDATHLTANADNVHWKEDAIDANECQPEVKSPKRFIHKASEHFWKPEIEPTKCCKQRSNSHYKVEVRHDEVSVLKLDICRGGSKK